jgi:DNA-binding response OmpR family regulator
LTSLLDGMRILVLEDEFLIAMDVEQLCRDHGARDVTIFRSLEGLDPSAVAGHDAAIIDVMLDGTSTLDFARNLHARGMPFVFASGYADSEEISRSFPGVTLVGKPYSGDDLIAAVASAYRLPPSGSV